MTIPPAVVALYVDPHGPYTKPGKVAAWFDAKRDAKNYRGTLPVVAHPPCGPWGRLKFLCTKQPADLGPLGVSQVRQWGGVLEHPSNSTLWKYCAMPRPGEQPDAHGGFSIQVNQCDWGHRCKKTTWLYIVGCPLESVPALPAARGFTHRITNGSRGDTTLPRVGALEARLSPEAFADFLIAIAASSAISPHACKNASLEFRG